MLRKYIPTKNDQFEKYIGEIKKVGVEDLRQTFELVSIKIFREIYLDHEYKVYVDRVVEPMELTLVKVIDDNAYHPPKGFVDVSDMEVFNDKNISEGSIISNNTIMEGTDGVGKSVSVEHLLRMGIICQDRSIEVVSKNMFFHIPMEKRVKELEDYLINGDKYIIFLVNNSKKSLEDRINKREVISEYDLEAYRYNGLYLDTYNYMKENNMLHDKLFLVDCTNLTIDEQVLKILEVMKYFQTPKKDVKSRTLK